MQKALLLLLFAGILLFQGLALQTCATPTSPTGGPRDTIGPRLVLEESTPNYQTNFRPEQIELTFDEWVNIDPKQEILISPPIVFRPDQRPELNRRTLVIDLEGVELLDSVTYVVNIGSAIQDFNEKNPTENLRFVFSTGPELDTARVTGTLVDAYSGEPLENSVFTLFGNLADTAVTTENPTYFAQTDEDGAFEVFNIRPGRYRAVALTRNTGSTNYFLDYAGTFPPVSSGFIDTILTVGEVVTEVGEVRLSPPPVPVRITAVDSTRAGLLKVRFNQPAERVVLGYQNDFLRRNVKDTALLFYQTLLADTLFAGLDSNWMDTTILSSVNLAPASSPGFQPLRLAQKASGRQAPGSPVSLFFNRPVTELDTSLVLIQRDTFPDSLAFRYAIDTTFGGELRLDFSRQPDLPYALTLLPGAVTDWLGTTNADTIAVPLSFSNPESLGRLTLRLTDLDPTGWYIVRLVKGENAILGTQRIIRERFDYEVVYADLKPDTYLVEVIYDDNKNGLYDGGDFRFRRSPEVVRRIEIQAVRANWEVEEEIAVDSQ